MEYSNSVSIRYANSTKPILAEDNSLAFSKREWAKDIMHVVDSLCDKTTRIVAYGHDRGARLAYRLALDFPDRVVGAAMLDIVPTSYVWDAMRLEKGHLETKGSHHWIFLSSPSPLPETMIASNPEFYYYYTINGWTGSKMKDGSHDWVKDSIAPYLDAEKGKERIAAACEDYRAGATHDIDDDFASSINPLLQGEFISRQAFSCPLLVLSSYHLRRRFDVDAIWLALGKPGMVESYQIGNESTGHFVVNEAQVETGRRTRGWLAAYWQGI